jgi:hypothetical protein
MQAACTHTALTVLSAVAPTPLPVTRWLLNCGCARAGPTKTFPALRFHHIHISAAS